MQKDSWIAGSHAQCQPWIIGEVFSTMFLSSGLFSHYTQKTAAGQRIFRDPATDLQLFQR
jgi:hypothetical protein